MMRCPKCDYDSLPGSQFCEKCGFNLTGVQVRQHPDYCYVASSGGEGKYHSQTPQNCYSLDSPRPTAAPRPTVAPIPNAASVPSLAPRPTVAPIPVPVSPSVSNPALKSATAYSGSVPPSPYTNPAPTPAVQPRPAVSAVPHISAEEIAQRQRAYAALEYRDSNEARNVYIDREEVIIGRDTGNVDVSVAMFPQSANTSRRHARLVYQSEGVFLEDLGSANGTFVNGERLIPQVPKQLFEGDDIRLGAVRFVFHQRRDQN